MIKVSILANMILLAASMTRGADILSTPTQGYDLPRGITNSGAGIVTNSNSEVIEGATNSVGTLTIIPTFDVSITSDPNAATIIAGINAAIGRVQSSIANNTTVTITFQEVATGLGGSS